MKTILITDALPVDGGWMADASWNSLRLRTRT
jgi:hypothetical protein